VTSLDEKETRINIETLQSLQRNINFLNKAAENNPSLEKTIEKLRNSQTQLYEALAQHGVTAEAVHQIIIENSDKQIVNEIMRLQAAKDKITKQLADPNLTPQKRQSLEKSFARTKQAHADRWQEIINSPRRAELIRMTEQAQIKQLARENRTRDRTHELDRTR
jgi:cytosine/adenosine deaminase-related metal-dependent hydrolase